MRFIDAKSFFLSLVCYASGLKSRKPSVKIAYGSDFIRTRSGRAACSTAFDLKVACMGMLQNMIPKIWLFSAITLIERFSRCSKQRFMMFSFHHP